MGALDELPACAQQDLRARQLWFGVHERELPLVRGLAPALASYDGAAELERGLDILLTGLTDSLTPSAAAQPGPGPAADDLQRKR